ncbi:hypothetical protein ACQKNB_18640 [Lysinibacillus xylanilyticus]|uniref:hypothetical protein n=1 Tax=Lysinibacillus xylanilyticus TaxID=582475 RepID=UPI003D017537
MVQGLIGGATNYNDQSINDIIEDLKNWISYSIETKKYIEENMNYLKNNSYWDNIPLNFQMTLIESIRCQNNFISDLKFILEAINTNYLTKREVELIKTIGEKAIKYNREYGITYKEESRWKKYGDKNFKVVESLYANGRDYFVTLQDAINVSERLNDYINIILSNGNNSKVDRVQINSSQYAKEINVVLEKLKILEALDPINKLYLEDLLKESKEVVENGDLEAQSKNKTKMKRFLERADRETLDYINWLRFYSNIASYFHF